MPQPSWTSCDVVVQAGHQNFPPGDNEGGNGPLGIERQWTAVIADETVRILRQAGLAVVKEDANLRHSSNYYRCKLAVFLHFDDPKPGPGVSGPSLGYSSMASQPAAAAWKQLYSSYWPFPAAWHSDNYTPDEHHYYGFGKTVAQDGAFLIEFGDMNNLPQAQWLFPRLHWLGALLAFYASSRLGIGGVADPGPFVAGAAPPAPPPPAPGAGSLQSPELAHDATLQSILAGHGSLSKGAGVIPGTGAVQDALNLLAAQGNPAWSVNLGDAGQYRGYFGARTENALKAFQTSHHLPVTGEVDVATLLALDSGLLALPPVPAVVPAPVVVPLVVAGGPPANDPLNPAAGAVPVGAPLPFSTQGGHAFDKDNPGFSAQTMGLHGQQITYSDGTVVMEGTEDLTAESEGKNLGQHTATQRRVTKGDTTAIRQRGYCWQQGRELPDAFFVENHPPVGVADGFFKTWSTMFGKNDDQDGGTGSPNFNLTQTCSEVCGASLRREILNRVFGTPYKSDARRLTALVEIYHPEKRRLARVPLVDEGPGSQNKNVDPDGGPKLIPGVDLTEAVDDFLDTQGGSRVWVRVVFL